MKRLTNSIAWAVIAASLLLFALSSCHGLEPEVDGGDGLSPDVTTLKLSFGDGPSGDDPESKVTIRSTTGKFLWSKDDRVAVWFAADPENPAGGAWAVSSEVKAEEKVDVSGDGIRCAVAIYPPESAVAGSYTTIRYPASYDLAGKDDEYVPVPMIAKNDANRAGLRFYHAGALLRFRIYAVPETTEKLVVSFTDKDGAPLAVTGEFAFSAAAGDSFATTGPVGATAGRNTVTFNLTGTTGGLSADTDNLVINVPVPVSTIGGFEIKAYKNDGSTSTIPASDVITQRQLGNAWAWDAHRALGLEKAVCFGYNPPENPIIGATDASHYFSVGPNKKVYIARADLAYFGESFPDSPLRLLDQPYYDDLPLYPSGKNSDFNRFRWASSGYNPTGMDSAYGDYLLWGAAGTIQGPRDVSEVELQPGSISLVWESQDCRVGYLKSRWDIGQFNRRDYNSVNTTPSGLLTYDGHELNGAWRLPRAEELLFLLGAVPNKLPVNFSFYANQVFEFSDNLQNTFPGGNWDGGGIGNYETFAPLVSGYALNYYERTTPLESLSPVTYSEAYFNFASSRWENHDLWHRRHFDGDFTVYVKTELPQTAYNPVFNSPRYNAQNLPLATHVSLFNPETMVEKVYLAVLPDGWGSTLPDPMKNRADGSGGDLKLALHMEDARQNSYTPETWRFFMEPAGAVLLYEFTTIMQAHLATSTVTVVDNSIFSFLEMEPSVVFGPKGGINTLYSRPFTFVTYGGMNRLRISQANETYQRVRLIREVQ